MGNYYPIYVDLHDKTCLVVGGGKVALRKVQAILKCNARVKLVGTRIIPEIKSLKNKYKNFTFQKKAYDSRDLKNMFLIIAATDSNEINTKIAADASRKGLLVNVVDVPKLCNFIVPSIIRRGDLTVSISTGGISPALAKMLRIDLEKHLGKEYAKVLSVLKTYRRRILRFPDTVKRNIWRKIIDPRMMELAKKKKIIELKRSIEEIIRSEGALKI